MAAHSGSSRASGCAASSTVTAAPSRRNACASSRPIGPAPITTRCSGRVVRSNTVSLVRCGVSASPGIGGSAGDEPVAITKRRALISICVADRDGALVLEAGDALDHPHAEAAEALLRIVRRDRRDDVVHVTVDVAEGDVGAGRRHAEGPRLRDGAGALAGGDQRFRRHATGIEAVAAHAALLDQHHRHAEGGGGGGDRQAAGAGADDADVGSQQFRHGFTSLRAPRRRLERDDFLRIVIAL